jgi:mono/diheme cytochrome c family protein
MSKTAAAALVLGLALSGAALAQTAAPAAPAAAEPKGDPLAGKKTYLANMCQACHGSVGQGGGPGPTLAATKLSYRGYLTQLRHPRSVMPPYGPPLMTDQEVADTYAYVKGLPGALAEKDLPAALKAP